VSEVVVSEVVVVYPLSVSEVPASLLEFFHEARLHRLNSLRPSGTPTPSGDSHTSQLTPTTGPQATLKETQPYFLEVRR